MPRGNIEHAWTAEDSRAADEQATQPSFHDAIARMAQKMDQI